MAEEAAQNVEATAQDAAKPASKPSGSDAGERGFPEGTPLEQMSVEQQAAYWKHHARQWEGRAKAFDGKTPEDLAALEDKASKFDALEYELQSDHDKQLAQARKEAADEARSELMPQLVRSSFDTHAARAGVDAEKLDAQLKYADLSKFVEKGQVNHEAISEFVDSLKPSEPERQKFPSGIGLGNRGVGGFLPGERGKAEAQRRFGTN